MFNKTEMLMIKMGRNERWPSSRTTAGFTSGPSVMFSGKPVRVKRKPYPVYETTKEEIKRMLEGGG